MGWGQGVCGYFDNDGFVDLFVTQWGYNVLLHNMHDGTFRDETKERETGPTCVGAPDALSSITIAMGSWIWW